MKAVTSTFEEVALEHLDAVYRAAVAISGQGEVAEDLTQSTFLKALKSFDSFKPGTNCKAWLYQILRNLWIDRLRHEKVVGTTVTLDETLVATEPSDEKTDWSNADDLLENFSDEQVIRALKQLPEDQRLTLFLVDVEQLSQQEVAEITDVAVGTVKSRCHRARANLKIALANYAKEKRYI